MTIQITLDLPETAFSVLRTEPKDFVQKMRLAAIVKWYELGMISQSKASEIAGISREEFLEKLSQMQVSPFQTTSTELAEELSRE